MSNKRNIRKVDFNLNNADLGMLPYSPQVERNVLGAIFERNELFNVGYKYLKPKGMFYDELNSTLWGLLCSLSADKGGVNTNTLHGIIEAKNDKHLFYHFLSICKTFSLSNGFINDCLLLNEFWFKRTIHRMGFYLNQNALKEDVDALDLLGITSNSLDTLYRHIAQMKEVTIKDGVADLITEIKNISLSNNGMIGLPSSLNSINNRIKGYRNGNLIIIAAGTGEGKTTLECQEVRNLAEQGISQGIISLEMTTSELILMIACDKLNISADNVLSGNIANDDMVRLNSYMEQVKRYDICISDKPAMKISEIKALARMWKKQKDIKILFIDHIHLIQHDIDGLNAEQRYTDIANELKALGKELDIPVIALAQLQRPEDKHNVKPHRITNIKYAGGIEQAADVVLLIFRPEHHGITEDANGNSTKGKATIIIGKLRLLKAMNIFCYFTGTRFTDNEPTFNELPQTRYDNPHAGIKQHFQTPKPPYIEDERPF